jgi:hypothetical protein
MDTEESIPLLNLLNNRQIALVIWLGIFILWILWRQDMRSSIRAVASTLFEPIVLLIFLLIAIYTSLWLRFFQQVQLWNITFIADTMLWFFGTGCILLLNITNVERDQFYFKNIVRETLAFTVIIEFLVNFYSFSLPIEILLVPVLFVVVGVRVVAESDEKHYLVKKIIRFYFRSV